MNALASISNMFTPAQMLLMLAVFSSVGLLVAVILLVAKLFGAKAAPASKVSDSDLERRRLALEIERMELENMERRQRISREQAPVAKAA
jgi:hypothetical protein